jgi:hypothetical protein
VNDLAGDESEELDKRLEAAAGGQYSPDHAARTDNVLHLRLGAVIGRMHWVQYSRFFTAVITIGVSGIFFVLLRYTDIFGKSSWIELMTYTVALFIAFQQLVQLASAVSGFGRFYPAVAQQKAMVEALQRVNSAQEFWKEMEKVGVTAATDDEEDVQ